MESMNRELEIFGKTFEIRQDFTGELGATVWDTALVLLKYIENIQEFPYPEFWKNKNIIDIGSGTGVVGIACALLSTGIPGCHVTLTDRQPLLELLNHNAFVLNKISPNRLSVKELEWGNPLPEAEGSPTAPFDVMILSDVVTKAYMDHYPALIKSIYDLTHVNSRIILGYELRDASDRIFFEMMKQAGFKVNKVSEDKLDPDFCSDDIGIFEIKRPETMSTENITPLG